MNKISRFFNIMKRHETRIAIVHKHFLRSRNFPTSFIYLEYSPIRIKKSKRYSIHADYEIDSFIEIVKSILIFKSNLRI